MKPRSRTWATPTATAASTTPRARSFAPRQADPLLRLQYRDSIADAVADLGRPDEISRVFSGFQKYLYEQAAA